MTRLFLLVANAGCGAGSAPRPAVSALTLDPPAAVLLVGESLQLHAVPLDASGNHLGSGTQTACACAGGSPPQTRRRVP